MINLKSIDDIEKIRKSGALCAMTLKKITNILNPGITTQELDDFARQFIASKGGVPAFLGYYGYPASVCLSINNEVIHGIPGKRKITEGDIIGVDLGIILDGFYSDACVTVGIGSISEERNKLLKITKECLYRAIEKAKAGNRLSEISKAIYNHAKDNGFDVVRKYCGHGVGFELHEEPQVYNYVSSGYNPRLKPGMVLAIEPMVNQGTFDVKILKDGWTVITADGKDSAHFEHTIAILDDHTEILTEGF